MPRPDFDQLYGQIRCQERMALGLGSTSYGLRSYELLFFNTDQQIHGYKI